MDLTGKMADFLARLAEYKKKAEEQSAERHRLESELEEAQTLLHELAVAQGWEVSEDEESEDDETATAPAPGVGPNGLPTV